MEEVVQRFRVQYEYRVRFTRSVFDPSNEVLREAFPSDGGPHLTLFVLDSGLVEADPTLPRRVERYLSAHRDRLRPAGAAVVIHGGEACKNDPQHLLRLHHELEAGALCRHSFVVAVGGGAVLDLAGFAAATVHRGLRLIRLPSTVLAQNDAGIGVKNGVNSFGKKNFLGTFAPPFAVINDLDLLRTLSERDLRCGMAEAVKVALVRDADFFDQLERDRRLLECFDEGTMERMVIRCARQHLEHISEGGDPFELGSARPLDFGHWTAHRLEEMTGGRVRHGEAVAVGMALDSCYACDQGLITEAQRDRVLRLLADLGFSLFHPELERMDLGSALDRFREHLGGELHITLPRGVGQRLEVHEMDLDRVRRCITWLERRYPPRT